MDLDDSPTLLIELLRIDGLFELLPLESNLDAESPLRSFLRFFFGVASPEAFMSFRFIDPYVESSIPSSVLNAMAATES